MTWQAVLYICVCLLTLNQMLSVEDSCRRIIAYVDAYTGASFVYAGLVHYEFLSVRLVQRLDLFRAIDF